MRIALGQFDSTVGDLQANASAIRALAEDASGKGADLLLLPEMCLLGYPARDLLLREEVPLAALEFGGSFRCPS